jgi:hypothetical protein
MEQENSNTTQPQATNNAGVDLKKLPKSAIVIAIICGVGTLGVFLPWFRLTYDFGFFGGSFGSVTVIGFQTFLGWLAFLSYGGAAAYALFGTKIKLPEGLAKNSILITGGSALLFTLIALLRYVSICSSCVGFGIYISLIAGVALLLVGLKVIKLT